MSNRPTHPQLQLHGMENNLSRNQQSFSLLLNKYRQNCLQQVFS